MAKMSVAKGVAHTNFHSPPSCFFRTVPQGISHFPLQQCLWTPLPLTDSPPVPLHFSKDNDHINQYSETNVHSRVDTSYLKLGQSLSCYVSIFPHSKPLRLQCVLICSVPPYP